jgi:hypothetical protein
MAFGRRHQEVCPFCFEPFALADTPFRCSSPMAYCAPEVDPVLQKRWGDNRPTGRVLPALGRFVRTLQCGNCRKDSTKRLCPTCHSNLPHTTGSHRNYIFAIIGAKESGKSHYLAVLIDQIKRRLERSLNALLMELSDDTIDRYKKDFYNPVFKDGRVIELTFSALADQNVQRPLIYSLTFTSKKLRGWRTIRRTVVLVFFDTAGEDLNAEDTMSTVNKYIYRSDGILLLVDPLQLQQVRDSLGKKVALPGIHTESSDIITRTTRLVQKGRGIRDNDTIPIPLAVAFSKFDAVKPLVHEQSQLNSLARHDGGFDTRDFDAISGEMQTLLEEWDSEHLVNQVHKFYPKSGFFGLSALGCNPHATKQIPRVAPQRVEDPFLWLLYVNKLIGAARKR